MNNKTAIVYIICNTILNLAFIAVAVGLSLFTTNFNFLWLLALPFFNGISSIESKSDKEEKSDETL